MTDIPFPLLEIGRNRPPLAEGEDWSEHEGFRETLLVYFTRPEDTLYLRGIAQMLFQYALECSAHWPQPPVPVTLLYLEAVARDLRHAERYLRWVAEDARDDVRLDDALAFQLAGLAAGQAEAIGRAAAAIEEELRKVAP